MPVLWQAYKTKKVMKDLKQKVKQDINDNIERAKEAIESGLKDEYWERELKENNYLLSLMKENEERKQMLKDFPSIKGSLSSCNEIKEDLQKRLSRAIQQNEKYRNLILELYELVAIEKEIPLPVSLHKKIEALSGGYES